MADPVEGTTDDIARSCLRPIRGCATDDQYCETLSRVTTAIEAASAREKLRKRAAPDDGLAMTLLGLAMRMKGRVEAIEDRDGKDGAVTGPGIGIGYLLARDLARRLEQAADVMCEVCSLDAVVHELGIEDSVATPAEAVLALKAELEEMTLGRGRLRLWLEFIHRNCTSSEAREYAGEALNGAHVPEGYDWDERSGRNDFLP